MMLRSLPFLLFVLLLQAVTPLKGQIQPKTDTVYRVNGHPSVPLGDLYFVDDTSGWVVGDSGVIGHWDPTSGEWVDQTVALDRFLRAVHFPAEDTGWVVGDSGTVLHSSDGGVNWNVQPSGDSSDLYGVHFMGTDTGWAVGDSGTVLHTEDGGMNWTVQASGTKKGLKAVEFVDGSIGYAVGDSGVTLRTSDGGSTWSMGGKAQATLHDLSFVNGAKGWACGRYGGVDHTDDSALTWQVESDTNLGAPPIYSMQMLDSLKGWVFGEPDYALFYQGGWWKTVMATSFFRTQSHHFFSIDTGWIAKKTGELFYFTNADSLEYDAIRENGERNSKVVKVRPNPFKERTRFLFHGPEYPRSFSLYTLQGREVRSKKIPKRRIFTLYRKGLPSGIYVYRFRNEDGAIASGRLVIR